MISIPHNTRCIKCRKMKATTAYKIPWKNKGEWILIELPCCNSCFEFCSVVNKKIRVSGKNWWEAVDAFLSGMEVLSKL